MAEKQKGWSTNGIVEGYRPQPRVQMAGLVAGLIRRPLFLHMKRTPFRSVCCVTNRCCLKVLIRAWGGTNPTFYANLSLKKTMGG